MSPITPGFTLAPVTRFQPLTPEEQHIEQDVMKYGYPDTAMLRFRTGYVLSYDGRTRTAHWVCEHLNADKIKGDASRRKSRFKEDPTIPVELRATLEDYKGSGFDKPHGPVGDQNQPEGRMTCSTFQTSPGWVRVQSRLLGEAGREGKGVGAD
jgi:DNA/RNA endonuclease G (NUC1)